MSSGACRALVAVLLALAATLSIALPMAAETERLREQSTAIYKVDPAKGSIDVDIVVKLTNNERQAFNLGTWGPLVMEELVVPRVSKGFAGRRLARPAGTLAGRGRLDAGHRGRRRGT